LYPCFLLSIFIDIELIIFTSCKKSQLKDRQILLETIADLWKDKQELFELL